jgi:hypothetical protein
MRALFAFCSLASALAHRILSRGKRR